MVNKKVQRHRGAEAQSKKGYHNLLIWKKAKELVFIIYRTTNEFPRSELYGLTSQARRATVSVLLNIVEGDRRRSRKEFLRFLDMADASLAELEACLELALGLKFIKEKDFGSVESKRKELAVMLSAFIKAVKKQL